MIYIVGIGPGHRDYILPKALKIMEQCDIIIGFKRAVDSVDFINVQKEYMSRLSDLDKYLKEDKIKVDDSSYDMQHCDSDSGEINNVAIIASGDPTFYGITNYIKSRAQREFEVIPGISSFQYLTSKARLPWNNAYTGSLHGRKDEFIKKVQEHEISIWLTDKENNPSVLCQKLMNENITAIVIVGENLSYEDEKITIGSPGEFINKEFSGLNILVINQE